MTITSRMTTNILSRNITRSRTTWMAIAALVLLTSFVGSATAQSESRDRDNPVRITSSEISFRVAPERELYYSFTAGPGEVTMTFDVLKQQRAVFANARITLFDRDAKVIRFKDNKDGLDLNSYLTDERVINRIHLDQRQQVTVRIRTTGTDPGRFRLRLTGAVELNQQASSYSPPEQETLFVLPARGAMHVEMKDGTVQQISLSEVRRVTVRQ